MITIDSEYLWMWSQRRIEAFLYSWCHFSIKRTWDRSSCYPLNEQVIAIKKLNCHLLCQMQCLVNDILINEVQKFLAPVPSETTHAIQLENSFKAMHQIIISLKLNKSLVTLNWKHQHERVWELWYPKDRTQGGSSAMGPVLPWIKQARREYVWWFVSPNTPARDTY